MPEVTLLRRRTPAPPSRPAGRHPKARMRTEDGVELVLPYAPRGTSLGGWADVWEVIGRPGRAPIVQRTGDGIDTLGIAVLLARPDHQRSIEDLLGKLRRIARSGDRITLVNLSPLERGPWRLEDVKITGELRQHGTNNLTRATADLSFIAAKDAAPRLGPVTGGRRKGTGNGKAARRTRHHTVKQGETLRKIADRYYGDPARWRLIARTNRVKHPNNMPIGRRLTIPPLKGK